MSQPATTETKRDRGTGQYVHTLDAVCRCGHTLAVHTGDRRNGEQSFRKASRRRAFTVETKNGGLVGIPLDVRAGRFEFAGFVGQRVTGEGCSAWDVRGPDGRHFDLEETRTLEHCAIVIAEWLS